MQAVMDEVKMVTGHRATSMAPERGHIPSYLTLLVPLFRESLKNRIQINLQLLLKPKNPFQPDLLGK